MTDLEIVGKFKRADNKKDILQILAELNACQVDEIKEVLLKNGISEDEFPKKRGKKPKSKDNPASTNKEKQAAKTNAIPMSVAQACVQRMKKRGQSTKGRI